MELRLFILLRAFKISHPHLQFNSIVSRTVSGFHNCEKCTQWCNEKGTKRCTHVFIVNMQIYTPHPSYLVNAVHSGMNNVHIETRSVLIMLSGLYHRIRVVLILNMGGGGGCGPLSDYPSNRTRRRCTQHTNWKNKHFWMAITSRSMNIQLAGGGSFSPAFN